MEQMREREKEKWERDKWNGTNVNIDNFIYTRRRGSPDDVFPALGGTRLLAVFTFGGMKRICLPSTVLTLPRPLMTMGLVEPDAIDGISILIGLLRYGELMPTFGRLVTVAADVVALFFSA